MKLLTEHTIIGNVNYSTNEPDSLGWTRFIYHWKVPYGQTYRYGKSSVFLRSRTEMLALLNKWNSSPSKYKYWM